MRRGRPVAKSAPEKANNANEACLTSSGPSGIEHCRAKLGVAACVDHSMKKAHIPMQNPRIGSVAGVFGG